MKNKNPLYVVSKDNVVEEVENYWQVIVKRFNLAPFIAAVNELIEFIWKQIDSYPMMEAAKGFLDKIIALFGFIAPKSSVPAQA